MREDREAMGGSAGGDTERRWRRWPAVEVGGPTSAATRMIHKALGSALNLTLTRQQVLEVVVKGTDWSVLSLVVSVGVDSVWGASAVYALAMVSSMSQFGRTAVSSLAGKRDDVRALRQPVRSLSPECADGRGADFSGAGGHGPLERTVRGGDSTDSYAHTSQSVRIMRSHTSSAGRCGGFSNVRMNTDKNKNKNKNKKR